MGTWVQKCKTVLKFKEVSRGDQFDRKASGIQVICFAKSDMSNVDVDPDPDPELDNLEILNFTWYSPGVHLTII